MIWVVTRQIVQSIVVYKKVKNSIIKGSDNGESHGNLRYFKKLSV